MKRSLTERVKAIFEFLKKQEKFVYKSDLRNIGLGPESADRWVELIQYIQKQPKLISKKAGKYTVIKLDTGEKKD